MSIAAGLDVAFAAHAARIPEKRLLTEPPSDYRVAFVEFARYQEPEGFDQYPDETREELIRHHYSTIHRTFSGKTIARWEGQGIDAIGRFLDGLHPLSISPHENSNSGFDIFLVTAEGLAALEKIVADSPVTTAITTCAIDEVDTHYANINRHYPSENDGSDFKVNISAGQTREVQIP